MTGRPRVAHVTVLPEFVDRIMLHDLRRLRDHEEITIICTEGAALSTARAEGFRVLTIPAHRKISPVTDLVTLQALVRIFRRERFDLVHTYAPKAGLLGQLAARLAGVPRRVHGCRGLLYSRTTPFLRRQLFRATDRLTSELADVTLYLSRGDKRFATEYGLCRAHRAHFIGSGVDLARFTRSPAVEHAARAWRREMGIGPDETLVLTVGRYVEDKGYRTIAEAAAGLRDRHPQLRFVWVAPVFAGEEMTLPRDLPEQYGVGDLVRLTDYIENMAPVLAAADILLHPSHREGVPRALLEAAAMGVPIVASDIPGCCEIVTHGESGLLFAPHDAGALADALCAAVENRVESAARATRARRVIEEQFDQDVHATRVSAAHRALLTASDAADGVRSLTADGANRHLVS